MTSLLGRLFASLETGIRDLAKRQRFRRFQHRISGLNERQWAALETKHSKREQARCGFVSCKGLTKSEPSAAPAPLRLTCNKECKHIHSADPTTFRSSTSGGGRAFWKRCHCIARGRAFGWQRKLFPCLGPGAWKSHRRG